MSASWKLTKKGGCSKIKRMFYHYYDTISNLLHIPNKSFYDSCESASSLYPGYRDNWRCYCKRMILKDYYNIILNEYNSFLE